MGGVPRGLAPRHDLRPGSPRQVEVSAPEIQQPPHQRPKLPEPVLHVHLLLLQGGATG